MKLLLTSAGFSNKSIVDALGDLANRPFSQLSLSFIPTAANVEEGSKDWLINDLVNCKNLGLRSIDIVDISALDYKVCRSRLEKTDISFVGGSNSFHLMNWLKRSGLDKELPGMLENKIYVGLSAGSCITAKWWSNKYELKFYKEKPEKVDRFNCLGFVDLFIMPHLNDPFFPNVRLEKLELIAREINKPLYARDNNSAVKIVGEKITVVSEGEWHKFN